MNPPQLKAFFLVLFFCFFILFFLFFSPFLQRAHVGARVGGVFIDETGKAKFHKLHRFLLGGSALGVYARAQSIIHRVIG